MNFDICKKEIVDENQTKSLVAYEVKRKKGEEIGWRRIFNRVCCDRCYEKIAREAGVSGIF